MFIGSCITEQNDNDTHFESEYHRWGNHTVIRGHCSGSTLRFIQYIVDAAYATILNHIKLNPASEYSAFFTQIPQGIMLTEHNLLIHKIEFVWYECDHL